MHYLAGGEWHDATAERVALSRIKAVKFVAIWLGILTQDQTNISGIVGSATDWENFFFGYIHKSHAGLKSELACFLAHTFNSLIQVFRDTNFNAPVDSIFIPRADVRVRCGKP